MGWQLPLTAASLSASSHSDHVSPASPSSPQVSAALLLDAVQVVLSAVQQLNRSQEVGVKPLSCSSPSIWQHGTSLINYLRMVTHTRAHTHCPSVSDECHKLTCERTLNLV